MDIEQRLQTLERDNRRMRRIVALSVGAAVSLVVLSCSRATVSSPAEANSFGTGGNLDMIRAKRIEIVGKNGEAIMLLTEVDGYPRMSLMREGAGLADLFVDSTAAGLVLKSTTESPHGVMLLSGEKEGAMFVLDKSAEPLAVFGAQDGGGRMQLINQTRSLAATLSVDKDRTHFHLGDPREGATSAQVSLEAGNLMSRMLLMDNHGRRSVQAIGHEGGRVSVLDTEGRTLHELKAE